MTIRLETFAELTEFAQPQYLVRPLLELGSTAMLFGPSGAGKTFLGIDLACSVATGTPWGEMKTRAMPVVYISAEGGRAFGRRIKAWYLSALSRCKTNEEQRALDEGLEHNLLALRRPLQLVEGIERAALIHAISEHYTSTPIGLVIFDTLARCSVGLEENSVKDMTKFVEAMVDIKTALHRSEGDGSRDDENHEPVMLVVHHTGKQPFNLTGVAVERGSSALRAALDVVIGLEPTAAQKQQESPGVSSLRLVVHKLKDGEEILPMAVRWDDTQVVGFDEEVQREMRGRVALLGPIGSARTVQDDKAAAYRQECEEQEARIVDLMEQSPSLSIREIASELDISKSVVGKRVKSLLRCGRVERKQGEYRVCETGHLNRGVPLSLVAK